MKVIVIGASGHIGTYLVPQLVNGGFEVVAVTRGKSKVYQENSAWQKVQHVYLDCQKDEDFALKIAMLNGDVVVDLINFDINQTKDMVENLKSTHLGHYLYCSSVWAHGRACFLPEDPNALKYPLDHYGRDKYESEQYLKKVYREEGFPATIIMPGQISGPGWTIMNPQATKDNEVFQKIADGEIIYLPNFGMETLHHVHAFDVAQMFYQAIVHRQQSLGESFHAVAKESMTLYGYALSLYRYFHQEPQIRFLSWEKFCDYLGNKEYIDDCYHHIARSGHYSIEKAQKLLGYEPRYTTWETIVEAMESYIEKGWIVLHN